MRWVCGVVRSAGGLLRAKVVNQQDLLDTVDLADMKADLGLSGVNNHVKGTFKLTSGLRQRPDGSGARIFCADLACT